MEEIVSYNSPKSSKEILNHEYRNDFSTDYSWSETFLVTKPLWCVFISKLCCVFYTVLFLSLAPLYLKIQNTTKHNRLNSVLRKRKQHFLSSEIFPVHYNSSHKKMYEGRGC